MAYLWMAIDTSQMDLGRSASRACTSRSHILFSSNRHVYNEFRA